MATLKTLAAKLNRLADRADDELKAAKLETAMAVITYLVEQTPVDTTEAKSNWRASTGGGLPGHIGPHVPGRHGSTTAASSAIAIATARAIFEAAPASSPLVISNEAPYIKRLNDGYSAQNAGGFVEASILVGSSLLRRRKWFRGK